jgi:hypothetical protein
MAYDTIDLLAGNPVLYVGEGGTFTEQELPYFLNIFGYTRRSCQYGIDLSAYAGKVIRGWHFKASFTVGGTESGRTCSLGLASGEWAGESMLMQREPSSRVYPTPNGLVELEDVFLPTRYPVTFIRPNGAPGSRDWRGVVLRITTGTGVGLTTTLSESTFEVAEIYVSDPPVLEVVGALPTVLPAGEDTIVTFSLRYAEDDPVVGAQIYVYGEAVGDESVTIEQLTWGEDDGLYQVRVRPNAPGYFTLYYRANLPPTIHDEFFYFQHDYYYTQITAQDQWSFASESSSEESSSCFWTDLVNVTQVCGEAPVGGAIAVWPWYSDAWDDVFWNPDVTPVELPELTERQTRTFALGDLLDGYGDVIDYCNNVVSGVKFDGSRMYTDPLEQGRNGCTGYFYGVSVALTPKADALYTMHAQDGGAFYPDLQLGYADGVAAKAYVNMTGEFRLLGVDSPVNVYAGFATLGFGSLVFTGTPTGAWTPIEDSRVFSALFYAGVGGEVKFGANSMTSYPAATFALDMEFEVVAERQARVAAKVVNLQWWGEDPDMEGFGLPEEPGDPLPGVIYIAEDIYSEPSVYVKSTTSTVGYGLVVGDLITVDPYTGEELENHGKMKFQFGGGG